MEKEFVDYNTALALKELGFDEPCIYYVDEQNNSFIYNFQTHPDEFMEWCGVKVIPTPTYSKVFRWFRKNHNLQHEITRQGSKYWLLTIFETDKVTANGVFNGKRYNLEEELNNEPDTYEEAELACLRKLIEIVKNK
jgi:hypothetical protein